MLQFDNVFSCPEALLEHLQRTGSLADCTIILTVRRVRHALWLHIWLHICRRSRLLEGLRTGHKEYRVQAACCHGCVGRTAVWASRACRCRDT